MSEHTTAPCFETRQQTTNCLVFEQPLNETIRLCLRIESLVRQFYAGLDHIACNEDHSALLALLKLLSVIDRPDIKSKITQTLSQQATTLAQLERFPQVDKVHLYDILGQLDSLLNQLHHTHCKMGDSLRHHPFINQVYSQINNPAGLNSFATPIYALWQNQSAQQRTQQLKHWMSHCRLIEQSVALILQLTRESTPFGKILIEDGFYHQALDPSLPCQLIALRIPTALAIYPEVSVGKHHLSIRIMHIDYSSGAPAQQYNQAFECQLACCRI